MSKEYKKTAVPKLRFPEFNNSQHQWYSGLLGEHSEVVRGGSPRPIDAFLTNEVGALNWLKIGDVDKEAKYVTHTAEKVKKSALTKTRVVMPGDLIMSNSMSFGRPYIMKIESCIHDGWIAVGKIDEEIDRDFLYYFISGEQCQKYFIKNAAGSGVKNLNAEIIKKLPLTYSKSKAEQQKIADCLSSLDELITAQGEKVDSLKNYKKGLLHQLFPQEGETVPRLRFPEFLISGGWRMQKLEELSEFITKGATPTTSGHSWVESGVPFLRSECVSENGFSLKGAAFITEKAHSEMGRSIVKVGDILMTITGYIGRTCVVPLSIKEANINQHIARIRIIPERANSKYVFHFLSQDIIRKNFMKINTGQAYPQLSLEQVRNTVIAIPSIKEQEMLATFFDNFDMLLSGSVDTLESLKLHKKGLLQQLFPSNEEENN